MFGQAFLSPPRCRSSGLMIKVCHDVSFLYKSDCATIEQQPSVANGQLEISYALC